MVSRSTLWREWVEYNGGLHIVEFSFFRSTSRKIITRRHNRRGKERRGNTRRGCLGASRREKMYGRRTASFLLVYYGRWPSPARLNVCPLASSVHIVKNLHAPVYNLGESGHPVGRDSLCRGFRRCCNFDPSLPVPARELLLSSAAAIPY